MVGRGGPPLVTARRRSWQATGKAKTVIWRWQERFRDEGAAGLWRDKTRRSRIPPLSPEVAKRVVAPTLAGPPPAASHWSGSTMAKAAGISISSVQRIWRAHGLQPHRVRQFKLSNDPQFATKLREIVGLYVDPPDHAIVLSVDEKSQIQALDRTQPGLPMKKGRAGTITHDYKRHGVTKAIYLDQGPEQNHRRRQTRAPSVRFDPLAYATSLSASAAAGILAGLLNDADSYPPLSVPTSPFAI